MMGSGGAGRGKGQEEGSSGGVGGGGGGGRGPYWLVRLAYASVERAALAASASNSFAAQIIPPPLLPCTRNQQQCVIAAPTIN